MEKAEREAELLRIENGEARACGGHGRPSVAGERRMPATERPVPAAARTWCGRADAGEAELDRAGFTSRPGREAVAQQVRKTIFHFLISNKFQITILKSHFSKKMAFSENGPKMKVA
jgi:hypothetical protein